MTNGYFWTYTALPRHQNARCESVNAIIDAIIVGFDGVPSAGAIQQDRVTHSTDTGVADAYVIAPTYPIVSYTAGQHYTFVAAHANTMASTVNVSALGVKTIKRQDGTDLSAGDIALGQVVDIRYDGTYFQLMSVPSGTVAAAATSATAAAASATAAASSASAASTSASAASTSATAAAASAAIFNVSTRQVLTSGSGATYTRPSGPAPRQLRIRLVGGGGGGGSANTSTTGGAGGNGGFTSFDNAGTNYKANGGTGGAAGVTTGSPNGGAGGTGGSGGTSPNTFSTPGGGGTAGVPASNSSGAPGGAGGSSILGGGAAGGSANAAVANSGGGGGGAQCGASGQFSGGGGGAGEGKEVIINSPAATYTYTIGAAGAAGTGDVTGGVGATGRIIVEEIY